MTELISQGRVDRPQLGMRLVAADPGQATGRGVMVRWRKRERNQEIERDGEGEILTGHFFGRVISNVSWRNTFGIDMMPKYPNYLIIWGCYAGRDSRDGQRIGVIHRVPRHTEYRHSV